jgi:hypothetical protein
MPLDSSILAYMDNMANCGYLRTQNRLRIRGKYLNVFGEYAERIYAHMERLLAYSPNTPRDIKVRISL